MFINEYSFAHFDHWAFLIGSKIEPTQPPGSTKWVKQTCPPGFTILSASFKATFIWSSYKYIAKAPKL